MSIFVHIIVILAYGLLAATLGINLAQSLPGVPEAYGYGAGATFFVGFALVHEVLTRRAERRQVAGLLRDLRIAEARTAMEVDHVRRDLGDLRRRQEHAERDGAERLAAEMQVLKTLLGQLAERLTQRRMPHGATAPTPRPAPSREAAAIPLAAQELLDTLRRALDDNRVDLYLQPVVSLPQRKVRFYEAFSRIRHGDGSILTPDQYLAVAAEHGLLTTIDNLLLFRCVQLIRRTRRRNRDVGFFVNISLLTLDDDLFFGQFVEFLEQNEDLAENLFFEFAQGDLSRSSNRSAEALERLAALGFRFSLDQIVTLDIDYAGLASRGFRFVKIDANALLSDVYQAAASIDVTDLKEALNRNGIDLIAEKIEVEPVVVSLLEFEVDFGQGWLFGEPKRSREDL